MFQVIEGDCLEVLKTMPDNSVDAIVTDPPAGIAFMGKDWDKDKGGRDHWIKWMSEVAAECYRVIKPGGHALVWALPRTSHWTGMAWENGGWEPRDKFVHLFGTGFPKSLDISKQIDKLHGAEREVVGVDPARLGRLVNQLNGSNPTGTWQAGKRCVDITAPATPDAEKWDGFGTALKPAHEDWWLFRRPLEGTVAENVLKHGTGGLNIGACRIGTDGEERPLRTNEISASGLTGTGGASTYGSFAVRGSKAIGTTTTGRWPANVVLTCSCDGADHSESCPVSQFPETKSGGSGERSGLVPKGWKCTSKQAVSNNHIEPNQGSAARFFYTAKASKRDRDEGLDESYDILIDIKPLNQEEKLWEKEAHLARLLVDMGLSHPRVIAVSGALSKSATEWNTLSSGKVLMDASRLATMFTTKMKISLTTELKILSWCLSLLISDYMEDVSFETEFGGSHVENVESGTLQAIITSEKMVFALGVESVASKMYLRISPRRNSHVTVKATPLMRWLCRLICPPGAVILDPFCGSGSTGKAAVLEGFDFIGIEQDPESVQVAKARIAWAAGETETAPEEGAELRPPYDDPVVKPTKILPEKPKQLSLFGV